MTCHTILSKSHYIVNGYHGQFNNSFGKPCTRRQLISAISHASFSNGMNGKIRSISNFSSDSKYGDLTKISKSSPQVLASSAVQSKSFGISPGVCNSTSLASSRRTLLGLSQVACAKYSSLYEKGHEEEFLKYKDLQEAFFKTYKVRIIHFGTKKDYLRTIDCIQYIEDHYKENLIPGVSLMLYDGKTILGEDLTQISVNRDIIDSEEERQRFLDLLSLLRKILYRQRMTPTEIQRWDELRGSGVVLPDYFRDILITRRFGVKGRTIFGIYITDSDIIAYCILLTAIITLLAMAMYGSYKKRRDMERAEENFSRMALKEAQEKRQREKITEMALERQRSNRTE